MSGKVTLERYAKIKKELNRFPDPHYQAVANKFRVSVDTVRRVGKTEDYLDYRKFWKNEYQGRLKAYHQKWADELRFASKTNPATVIFAVIATVLAVLYAIWLIGGMK